MLGEQLAERHRRLNDCADGQGGSCGRRVLQFVADEQGQAEQGNPPKAAFQRQRGEAGPERAQPHQRD
ncbi:MAG: hypothetical protein C4311_14780 [Chloroflexota bacterium]